MSWGWGKKRQKCLPGSWLRKDSSLSRGSPLRKPLVWLLLRISSKITRNTQRFFTHLAKFMPRLLWSLKGEQIMSCQEIKAREKKQKSAPLPHQLITVSRCLASLYFKLKFPIQFCSLLERANYTDVSKETCDCFSGFISMFSRELL